MQEFFELASERGWIYEIPAGSNINHTFNCSKDTFESEKSKVIPATAPSSRSILSSQRPFAVTSNSAKRPASTAPPVAGTLAYSPSSIKRSADAGTNVDHSARPSPISRPQKIRKTATMYKGKLGSEIRIKARPVLRDILDSL